MKKLSESATKKKNDYCFQWQVLRPGWCVALGSPLGPVLANFFMRDFEEKWVRTSKNRPSVWFRYADDAFALFDDKKSASQFLEYLNSRHNNVEFTIEFEQNDEIPFLDILLLKHCPDNAFMPSI